VRSASAEKVLAQSRSLGEFVASFTGCPGNSERLNGRSGVLADAVGDSVLVAATIQSALDAGRVANVISARNQRDRLADSVGDAINLSRSVRAPRGATAA
jgi:hypothetical protein